MPHLAELDLNFEWSAVSAGALADALPALTALTDLDLSSDGDALCVPAIAAVSRCPQLRSLSLCGFWGSTEWVSALTAALAACTLLTGLRLIRITSVAGHECVNLRRAFRTLSAAQQLGDITVEHYCSGNDGATMLCSVLRPCTALQQLDLNAFGIRAERDAL